MSTADGIVPESMYIERAERLLALLRRDFGLPRGTRTVIGRR